ncbi:MAG: hypothetical protein KDA53_11395 [Hyphomonas sp.]|nr:hypothetical protein [Hyphomonas sp.]
MSPGHILIILAIVVLGFGFSIGVHLFLRWDPRKRDGVNQNRLQVPVGSIIVVAGGGVLFLAIGLWGVATLVDWSDPDTWLALLFMLPGLGMLWMAIAYPFRSLTWDKRGICVRQFRRPEAAYTWRQIIRVDYIVFAEAWQLWLEDGRRFQLPERMIGLEAFMTDLVRHRHIDLRDHRLTALRDSLNDPDEPI